MLLRRFGLSGCTSPGLCSRNLLSRTMPTLNANSNLAEWGFPMNGYMFIAVLKSFYRLAAGFEHPSPGSAGFQYLPLFKERAISSVPGSAGFQPAMGVTEFFAGKMPTLPGNQTEFPTNDISRFLKVLTELSKHRASVEFNVPQSRGCRT